MAFFQTSSASGVAIVESVPAWLIAVLSDAISDVFMEIVIFCIAVLIYFCVMGYIPGLSVYHVLLRGCGVPSHAKKLIADGCSDAPEEERLAKELQAKLVAGDHKAALKLWMRLKTSDKVTLVDLVQTMRSLNKAPAEICRELRSALDCNPFLAESVAEVFESLRGPGTAELRGRFLALLKEKGMAPSSHRWDTGSPTAAKGARTQSPECREVAKIKACGRDKDLNGAVRAFEELKSSGVQVSSLHYNTIIEACVQCGEMKSAEMFFEQMKVLDLVSTVSYNTFIKGLLTAGNFEAVRKLLKEMEQRGLKPTTVTYNELLNARVCAKDKRGMWNVIDDMQSAGVSSNPVTCSIVLKSLGDRTQPNEFNRAIDMFEKLCEPMDEVLFSSLIEACSRMGHIERLTAMLERPDFSKHVAQGLTAPTYGSMIKAYGQVGNIERVWRLWYDMKDREIKPTVITIGCTVEALVKNGCVEDAWKLTQQLLKDESLCSCVNTVVYSTILKGFGSSRTPKLIFTVLAEMKERGVECNTITFNTMIDACARCGCMDQVPKLLEEMKNTCVELDTITYTSMVKGYCMSGDLDRAFGVLKLLKKDGCCAADEILYNSLLDGCAKQNRIEEALSLFEEMRAASVKPSNYTLSILVKLLGRARRLTQAFSLVQEMRTKHNVRPNIHVYTCLAQACIQNRKIEKAVSLHDTMLKDGGCQPDQRFYSALARGCIQAGALHSAASVVRCALHLPDSGMAHSREIHGLEQRMVEEILAKLRSSGKDGKDAATKLSSDLATTHSAQKPGPAAERSVTPPWRRNARP